MPCVRYMTPNPWPLSSVPHEWGNSGGFISGCGALNEINSSTSSSGLNAGGCYVAGQEGLHSSAPPFSLLSAYNGEAFQAMAFYQLAF